MEHPIVTQINKTGYPKKQEESKHFGIDAMGDEILVGDEIVIDPETDEIILEENLEDYLIEFKGFQFKRAE